MNDIKFIIFISVRQVCNNRHIFMSVISSDHHNQSMRLISKSGLPLTYGETEA